MNTEQLKGAKEEKPCEHYMAWNILNGYSYYRCMNCTYIDGEKTFSSHHNQLLDRVIEGMPNERIVERPTVKYEGGGIGNITFRTEYQDGFNEALSQCKESIKKLKV